MKKIFLLCVSCCILVAQLSATPPFKVKKEAIAISPEQTNIEEQKLSFFQRVILKKMQKKADKLLRKLQQGDCDIMITMERKELLVKVVEIGQDVIKYKKCNFQDGPSIVIAACDVFLIKYANGSTETPQCPNGLRPETKKTNGLAIAAAATAGGGLLFLFLIPILGLLASIAALVLGFISLRKIKKSKAKQKGKGWAWAAIGVGGLIVLLTGLLFLLVFLY